MQPRLDIKHLAVLAAIAETGSVTATAARLALTQSAVSHRLREAERRLGVPLAERYRHGVRLTPAGERLRAVAAPLLRELGIEEQALREEAGRAQRRVRLGQATYSRYHWLPAFLEFAARELPDLEVDLSGTATARPFAALAEAAVDVATLYGRETVAGRYRWYRLATDPLVAVLAPGHRLAGRTYLDPADIAAERYFSYPLTAEPGFDWSTLLGNPGVPFRRVTPMPAPEAVVDLVRAGLGVGIFSRWAVEPEVADGTLVALPITDAGISLDWWAVTGADEPDDSPASRLARSLVRWAGRRDAGLATLAFEAGGGGQA